MDLERLVLVHTGETGVERGAHRAAVKVGMGVTGFCSSWGRDEYGPLPPSILDYLRPYDVKGTRSARIGSLELAEALVVIAPRLDGATNIPGIGWLLTAARKRGRPYQVVDANVDIDAFMRWLEPLTAMREKFPLMVTGPRETRWSAGDGAGARFILALADAIAAAPSSERSTHAGSSSLRE